MPALSTIKHNFLHYLLVAAGGLVKGVAKTFSWALLATVGFLIFSIHYLPFDLMVGLPLIIGGAGMGLGSLWEVIVSVISPEYNRTHCRLCQGYERRRVLLDKLRFMQY